MGRWGALVFLIGAFGTVFSSLLGVWQSVPYLFADCWGLVRKRADPEAPMMIDTNAMPYRVFLFLLGIIPIAGLFWGFQQVQKVYTVTGALFFPFLALALLGH